MRWVDINSISSWKRKISWKMSDCWRKITGFIPASILCIRFPFLYPRNRWTGKHYNNWKINDRRGELYKRYHILKYDTTAEKFTIIEDRWVSRWGYFRWMLLGWLEDIIGIFHAVPYYTELDSMPAGWRKAFGIQMCKEIKDSLLRSDGRKLLNGYRITQIKEKYGELCWYDSVSTREVQKIINKYAYISRRTCIVCGRPATGITPPEYYECPYCDDHRPELSRFFLEYGYGGMNWYGYAGNVNGRGDDGEEAKLSWKEYDDLRNGAYGDPGDDGAEGTR